MPIYDLEKRTKEFAKNTRAFVRSIRKTITNIDDCKQVIRSSGSVAANYIEANESVSRPDFIHRIKICRKEAKESSLWFDVLDSIDSPNQKEKQKELRQESYELERIFAAILRKTDKQ